MDWNGWRWAFLLVLCYAEDDGLLQRRLFFPNFAAVCARSGTVAAMSRSEAETEIRQKPAGSQNEMRRSGRRIAR